MSKIITFGKRIAASPWVAEGISLLGGILFVSLMFGYAHTRDSVLDEGAYLYKGYLYAIGKYTPFQWYGPWTNHMPLSFLIPGYVQRLFGPDLGIARYFSVFVAALLLLGYWLLARRLGGRWWGAIAVWAMILNPAVGKMYSLATSQVLVACMLIWALAFILGENRPDWQIAMGGVFGGMMILTRVNMAPVLPLLVLYVIWQHGWKSGLIAGVAGGAVLIIGHAIYWPGILQMWAAWLPRELTPFLNEFRLPPDYARPWNPDIPLEGRILSLLQALRFHFTFVAGAAAALLLWPKKEHWKTDADFRVAVLLFSLFSGLFLLHTWAALFNNYCVFCLESYLAFFSPIGLLLVIITFSAWQMRPPWWRVVLILLFVLLVFTGIGYGSFQEIGGQLVDLRVPGIFLTFPRYTPGRVRISRILSVRYELDFLQQRQLVSMLAGIAVGLGFLLLLFIITLIVKRFRRKSLESPGSSRYNLGYWSLVCLLMMGIIVSPAKVLGGGATSYDCKGDTIASYRALGDYLANTIPRGALVYWKGGSSIAPLLYVPDIKIFPPQMEDFYTEYFDADEDILLKFGLWDREINNQWLTQADYVLVQERYYKEWSQSVEPSGSFETLEPSPPTVACYNGARILIFKRVEDNSP